MKRKMEEEDEEDDEDEEDEEEDPELNWEFSLPPPPMYQPPPPMPHQLGEPHFVGRGWGPGSGPGPWGRGPHHMRGGFRAGGSMNGGMVNGNMMGGQPFFRGPRDMPNGHGFFPRGRGSAFNNSFPDMYWNQSPMPMPFHQQQELMYSPLGQQLQHQQLQQQFVSPSQSDVDSCNQNISSTLDDVEETVKRKTKSSKRRPMSQSYPSRPWKREDAKRALQEEAAQMKGLRSHSLVIKFPDPELSKDIVKSFHSGITNVYFQVPSGARYCFVQLSEDADPEKAVEELQKIKFGCGNLVVEKKYSKDEEEQLSPEDIDPYTLYVGNLPRNVNVACVKQNFPTAARVDIGFPKMLKCTRYAFLRYNTVDEAIKAYKKTHDLVIDSRSIIVRFRRLRGHVGLPGEPKPQKQPKKQEEKSKQKLKKGKEDKDKKIKVKDKEKNKEKGEFKSDEESEKDDKDEDDDNDDSDADDSDADDEDDDDDDDDDEEDDDEDDDDDDDEDDEDEDDDEDDEDDDDDDDEEMDSDPARTWFDSVESQISGIDGVSFPFLTD